MISFVSESVVKMSIKMNKRVYLIAFIAILVGIQDGQAQELSIEGVEWQKGVSIGDLDGVAQIRVPSGYVFAATFLLKGRFGIR